MTTPTRLRLLLASAVILLAACRDAVQPTTPRSRSADASAAYDVITLEQWFPQASASVLALSTAAYADVNEQTSRLEFGVTDEATREEAISRLTMLGIPSDAYLVEIVGPIVLEQDRDSLTDKIRPTIGGIQIQHTMTGGGTGTCTLGFNITQAGKRYFVAASHCTEVRGTVEQTAFFQAFRLGQPGSSVGVEERDPPYNQALAGCPANRLCRESDAALIRYNAATRSTLSRIARPDVVNNGSLEIDAANPQFAIAFVAATTRFGGTVNKVGHTTGWTQGPVTRTCANVNANGADGADITLICQTQVKYNTGPADSGSPVFEISADGTVVLLGIHVVGQLVNNVKHGWFSPFPSIAKELGFTTISQ